MHTPTPSQQNALLAHIYAAFTRPPVSLTQYRYCGVNVYILKELPGNEVIIQTVDMQKALPVPGLHNTLNYHAMAKVPRAKLMPAGVVAHVRADVGSVLFA